MSIKEDVIKLDNLIYEELTQLIIKENLPKFRAEQIFRAIHKEHVTCIEEITTLSKDLREKLSNEFALSSVDMVYQVKSKISNASKYLFKLEDGNLIETVFMDYNSRRSICISSQVGCRMGCVFCASTKGGRARNITAGEMLRQIYAVEELTGEYINNIVIMGQGEPLDNFDNLVKFLNIIGDERGANKSLRKITVSTCGISDKIKELANMDFPITLAISLHRTSDEDRSKLMPINDKYNIEGLINATQYYYNITGRRPSFEYMVIGGENDRDIDAQRLKEFVNQTHAHINVLELNPIEEYSNSGKIGAGREFAKKLNEMGLNATFRNSMGQDIEGACGQLRRKFKGDDDDILYSD